MAANLLYGPFRSTSTTGGTSILEVVSNVLKEVDPTLSSTFDYKTPVETLTATGDDSTGDYENADTNIQYSTSYWENTLDQGSDITSPSTPISVISGFLSSGTVDNLLDNATSSLATDGLNFGSTSGSLRIDLGSAYAVSAINWNPYVGYLTDFEIWMSNSESSGYAQIASIDVSGDTHSQFNMHTFSNSTAYRYVEIRFSSQRLIAWEAELLAGTPSSTNNTVDAVIPFSGTKNFAPASVVIKDDGASEIVGTSKINLAYNINGGGFSSLVDLQTFKLLDSSLFNGATSLKVRVQPVGSQKFTDVDIGTVSSGVTMGKDGSVEITLASGRKFYVNNQGQVELDDSNDPTESPADGTTIYSKSDTVHTKNSAGVIKELAAEIVTVDLALSGSNVNVVDAVGYVAGYTKVRVRLTGTISQDTTITMPAITSTPRYIEVKDAAGNGLSNPNYKLSIIPDGSDSIDESAGLTNEFELDADYQSQGFYSNNSNTKWEA